MSDLLDIAAVALLLVAACAGAWLVLRGIGEAGAGVGSGLGSALGGLGGALSGIGAGIGSAIAGGLSGLGSGVGSALRGVSSLIPRGGGTRGPMERRAHTFSATGPSRLAGLARRAGGAAREAARTVRWSAGGAAAEGPASLVALDVGEDGAEIVELLDKAGIVATLDARGRLIMLEDAMEAALATLDAAGYAMRDETGVERINEEVVEGEVLNV